MDRIIWKDKLAKFLSGKDLKDLIWGLVGFGLSSVIMFILRVILGNYLGLAGFGFYNFVFIVYQFGTLVSAFGLGISITKYVSEIGENEETERSKKISTYGITSSFLIGIIIFIILFFSSSFISNFFRMEELAFLLKIVALSFPFLAILKTSLGVMNGYRQISKYAITNIVWNLLILTLTIIFVITLKDKLLGSILGLVIAAVTISIISLILIRKDIDLRTIFKLDNLILRKMFVMALAVFPTSILSFLKSQLSNIVLAKYLTEYELGLFGVALTFYQILILLPSAVFLITTPKISKYYADKEQEKIKKINVKTVFIMFLINLGLNVFLISFGKIFIRLLFGVEYIDSYLSMVILVLSTLFYVPLASIGGVFVSIEKSFIATVISILSVISIFIASFFFIRTLNIVGAAIAHTIGNMVHVVFALIFMKKYKVI
ncbi:MAG: oligosaccharide flippase family protein [Candidatus Heimdallarchaeaceae archaeon]